mgnify:CR=1 FL=1
MRRVSGEVERSNTVAISIVIIVFLPLFTLEGVEGGDDKGNRNLHKMTKLYFGFL